MLANSTLRMAANIPQITYTDAHVSKTALEIPNVARGDVETQRAVLGRCLTLTVAAEG